MDSGPMRAPCRRGGPRAGPTAGDRRRRALENAARGCLAHDRTSLNRFEDAVHRTNTLILPNVSSNRVLMFASNGTDRSARWALRSCGDRPRMSDSMANNSPMRSSSSCAAGDFVATCTSQSLRRACAQHATSTNRSFPLCGSGR
jgi:hypothetical protein